MATEEVPKLESRAYINGHFTPSLTQPPSLITITSPSTFLPLGAVEAASSQDVEFAVAAASAAFKGPWSLFTGSQRAACLNKFADLFEEIAPRVAEVESLRFVLYVSERYSLVGCLASFVFLRTRLCSNSLFFCIRYADSEILMQCGNADCCASRLVGAGCDQVF
jgi:hypothetical protein